MVVETAAVAAVAGVGTAQIVEKTTEHSSPELALLTEIRDNLVALRAFSPTQRFRTLYPFDLGQSVDGVGRRYYVDGQVRGHHLAFSGGTAGAEMRLMMGTMYVMSWIASGSYMDIDLPLMLTSGSEIYIVNGDDDDDWACWLWYEREQEDISHKKA